MTITIRQRSRQWIPSLITAFCLCGALTATAQETSGSDGAVRDAWLDGKLEAALLFNPYLNSFDIHTDVRDGVAHLSGFVESDIDRDLAGEIADSIEGVNSVENGLEIDQQQAMAAADSDADIYSERRTLKETVSDLTLGARVKTRLLTNDNTTGSAIDVDAAGGVVTLTGTVDSMEEKELAGQLTANIPGANEVKNMLLVVDAES
jgi:osmotically-inducible protein OsmY